jgi:exodeoxyribonuclease-3
MSIRSSRPQPGSNAPFRLVDVRLISYNVNSIGARLPRLIALLDRLDPDVVCVQETKCTPEKFPHLPLEGTGYVAADHSGGRWAGVAVIARHELGVDDVTIGLPGEAAPDEARWVEATVDGVRCVSTYVPNGQALGTEAFAQKLVFLEAMADRAATLADRPTMIAGDMNVCPADIDVWNADQVHGATHITDDERSRLAAVLETGYVDSFRRLHPEEPGFTWWDYRAGHFHKGYGLRIDLALASTSLAGRLEAAEVNRAFRKPTTVPESKPSDHAPLVVDFS